MLLFLWRWIGSFFHCLCERNPSWRGYQLHYLTRTTEPTSLQLSAPNISTQSTLCSLFQPDTDGTRVSKCRQFSQETWGLDPMLFQYWSRAVSGGGGQYWNSIGSNPRVCCLHPPLPSRIFSPADQGTFSKTAGQSQAYYNTWNWEWGTSDVNHLQILTCEVAVSTAGSVNISIRGVKSITWRYHQITVLHSFFIYWVELPIWVEYIFASVHLLV